MIIISIMFCHQYQNILSDNVSLSFSHLMTAGVERVTGRQHVLRVVPCQHVSQLNMFMLCMSGRCIYKPTQNVFLSPAHAIAFSLGLFSLVFRADSS